MAKELAHISYTDFLNQALHDTTAKEGVRFLKQTTGDKLSAQSELDKHLLTQEAIDIQNGVLISNAGGWANRENVVRLLPTIKEQLKKGGKVVVVSGIHGSEVPIKRAAYTLASRRNNQNLSASLYVNSSNTLPNGVLTVEDYLKRAESAPLGPYIKEHSESSCGISEGNTDIAIAKATANTKWLADQLGEDASKVIFHSFSSLVGEWRDPGTRRPGHEMFPFAMTDDQDTNIYLGNVTTLAEVAKDDFEFPSQYNYGKKIMRIDFLSHYRRLRIDAESAGQGFSGAICLDARMIQTQHPLVEKVDLGNVQEQTSGLVAPRMFVGQKGAKHHEFALSINSIDPKIKAVTVFHLQHGLALATHSSEGGTLSLTESHLGLVSYPDAGVQQQLIENLDYEYYGRDPRYRYTIDRLFYGDGPRYFIRLNGNDVEITGVPAGIQGYADKQVRDALKPRVVYQRNIWGAGRRPYMNWFKLQYDPGQLSWNCNPPIEHAEDPRELGPDLDLLNNY